MAAILESLQLNMKAVRLTRKNDTIKCVVIVSGGMDSVTLLHNITKSKEQRYEVHALSFNYGQRHSKELLYAFRNCEELGVPHTILNLQVLNNVAPSVLTRCDRQMPEGHYTADNMKDTVVPNRNMVMISIAVAYCIGIEGEVVFYGAHAGDHAIYPDCRPAFVEAMEKAIKLCDWHDVHLEAPYLHLDKTAILKIGQEYGVDYKQTWTCYAGKDKACGKCGSCAERLEAFRNLGLVDPIRYE